MRILVTGAGGFSGSVLVHSLLAQGWEVIASLGRESRGYSKLDGLNSPQLTICYGDLVNSPILLDDVEAVVHTGAVSPAPGIKISVSDFIHNNAQATLQLISKAAEKGVTKFLFFSSVSVFGDIAGPVLDESCPRINPSPYGVSKWIGEMALQDRGNGMASLSLRLPSVLGPGAVRNWFSSMATAAREGSEIQFFHGDAEYNNAVHINDLCQFIIKVLEGKLTGHDMITLGAEGTINVRAMVRVIVEGLGNQASLHEIPPPRPPFCISIARAKRLYGFQSMSMVDMVNQFVWENQS